MKLSSVHTNCSCITFKMLLEELKLKKKQCLLCQTLINNCSELLNVFKSLTAHVYLNIFKQA